MTEYLVLLALVAVFLIGIITQFGDKLNSLFGTAVTKLDAVEQKLNSTGGNTSAPTP